LKIAQFAVVTALACAMSLTGCSKPDVPAKLAQPYETIAAQAKGFTAGALMSANTVYVMFDPQCPHCGHLWEASAPLQSRVKFVWVPVSIINAKSRTQGAALLAASNPVEAMTAHEKSILAGGGGMSASSDVPPEIEQAIKTNTSLFNGLGADSVPYILARHAKTGLVVSNAGAMDTQALAVFIGVDAP
jgi:thiol:disulfide interchange protein DsbG